MAAHRIVVKHPNLCGPRHEVRDLFASGSVGRAAEKNDLIRVQRVVNRLFVISLSLPPPFSLSLSISLFLSLVVVVVVQHVVSF